MIDRIAAACLALPGFIAVIRIALLVHRHVPVGVQTLVHAMGAR